MEFRRQISAMEWEHRRRRMKIVDLKNHMREVSKVIVTKDIQTHLKMKARGLAGKEQSFEQELEMMKKSYEKMIGDWKQNTIEVCERMEVLKNENTKLDKKIVNVNVDVCELKLNVDDTMEQREKDILRMR